MPRRAWSAQFREIRSNVRNRLGGLAGLGIASIPEALGLTMIDLIERIRRIIEQHREVDRDDAPGVACGCVAEGYPIMRLTWPKRSLIG